MYRNKLIGSVEISYSFNAIKRQLKMIYPTYYSFIVKKEIIEAKVLQKEQGNYISTSISSNYLQDKETLDKYVVPFEADLISKINENISTRLNKKLSSGQDFLLETCINKKHFLVTFIAVNNVQSKQVAYYVIYQENQDLDSIHDNYILQLMLSLFISIFFSSLLILYYRQQQRTAKALKILATTDPLTKIANRHKLNMVMEILIHRSQRYALPLSVIFFDIDHFKEINDKLGHETGDEILVELSKLVTRTIRSADLFARWGGEEFIIVLPETNRTQAKALAEKLRHIIEEHHFVITAKLTCSFGVTQLHKDDTEASLLKRVDTALYSAKDSGRNRVIELN
jgi:diguanylate cyclase (GGDEF)-like protein